MTTAWNGSPYHLVCCTLFFGLLLTANRPPAWDDVSSRKDEEKKTKENEFRSNHPHLAEWKEARFPLNLSHFHV
jgi:hypothetical protein